MRHIELRLNTLKRPKLILEAARNGLAGYDPGRHLPALIGRSLHRSKIGQLDYLLDMEETYNRLRKEKRAEYSPARHIRYLIAIIAEYTNLKKTKDQRSNALDKCVGHRSFFVSHIFLKRRQNLRIERRLLITGQLMGHAVCRQAIGVTRALFVPGLKGLIVKQI